MRLNARIRILSILVCFVLASCARFVSSEDIRLSTEPEIKSLVLTNGKTVIFDEHLGWYDAANKIVDGTTSDGKQVAYNLSDIRSAELIHGYQAYFAVAAVLGLAVLILFGGYQLLHLLKVL